MAAATGPSLLSLPLEIRNRIYHDLLLASDAEILAGHVHSHSRGCATYGARRFFKVKKHEHPDLGHKWDDHDPLKFHKLVVTYDAAGYTALISTSEAWMTASKQIAKESLELFQQRAHWSLRFHPFDVRPITQGPAAFISTTEQSSLILPDIYFEHQSTHGLTSSGALGPATSTAVALVINLPWINALTTSLLLTSNKMQELTINLRHARSLPNVTSIDLSPIKHLLSAFPNLAKLTLIYWCPASITLEKPWQYATLPQEDPMHSAWLCKKAMDSAIKRLAIEVLGDTWMLREAECSHLGDNSRSMRFEKPGEGQEEKRGWARRFEGLEAARTAGALEGGDAPQGAVQLFGF